VELKSLSLTNFRSYKERTFEFSSGVTVVVGPNASGKTNLLESLYVLASTKSFRTKDVGLIRHGQDHFRIVGNMSDDELALAYLAQDGKTTKQASRNGTKQSLVNHVGSIQVTLFEPTDLELNSGPPDRRRRYLDFLLCQTDREYLRTLANYRRVLRQRNSLLSGFNTSRIKDEIFAWDIKLTESAAEIYRRRVELVEYLNKLIPQLYKEVAAEEVSLRLDYQASVATEDYASNFLDALAHRLTADLAAGFTTIGPHREDFKVSFKNNNISAVASRGETRTVVLVMKLAELAYNEENTGIKPILLLDDVFSELDNARRKDLVLRVAGHQTIITTTEADAIKEIMGEYQLITTEATGVRG
jgi:DNA replication and repair protein RecF